MSRLETYEYSEGAELPTLGHWYYIGDALQDFATGYTFTLTCKTRDKVTTMFTKTTGITGAAGALPVGSTGTPSITVAWATTAELSTLTAGETYFCSCVVRRTADSKDFDSWDFFIKIRDT